MIMNKEIVNKLWKFFDKRQFAEVAPLLADDFVCIWPQSKELIRGADNFIALNENYPGEWSINCKRVVDDGVQAVSEVELNYDGQVIYATSFFEFMDGRITKMTEHWSDPYEAPEWRSKWVEMVRGG